MAEAEELEAVERERAEKVRRQKISASRSGETVETLPPSQKTRDKVAAAVGLGSGSQKMAEAEELEAIERERARERQREAGVANLPTVSSGNVSLTHKDKGQTRDKVAAAVGLGSGRTYDKAAKLYCHSTANRPETGRHQRTTRSRRKYPKASIQATFGRKRTRAQRGNSELNIAHIVEAGGSSPFLPTTHRNAFPKRFGEGVLTL
jgi:hypothetical protein